MADCHCGILVSVLVNSLRYKGYQIRTVFKESKFGNWAVSKFQQPTTNLRCLISLKSEGLNYTVVEF